MTSLFSHSSRINLLSYQCIHSLNSINPVSSWSHSLQCYNSRMFLKYHIQIRINRALNLSIMQHWNAHNSILKRRYLFNWSYTIRYHESMTWSGDLAVTSPKPRDSVASKTWQITSAKNVYYTKFYAEYHIKNWAESEQSLSKRQ